MSELLNLESEKKSYLSIIDEGQCIIRVNSIKKPFLLGILYIKRNALTVSEIYRKNEMILGKQQKNSDLMSVDAHKSNNLVIQNDGKIKVLIYKAILRINSFRNKLQKDKGMHSKEIPIVKQYKEFLTNFLQFIEKWSKSLKLGYYLKETQVLRLTQDFSTSMMDMNGKFTSLVKQYQAKLFPRKEPLNNTCPSCNKIFDADAAFCKYCGAQLQGKTRFIPRKVKEEVLARDNWQCVMCGKKEDLQFDHIIPYSKGGSNTAENLQILCTSCNKKKYINII